MIGEVGCLLLSELLDKHRWSGLEMMYQGT